MHIRALALIPLVAGIAAASPTVATAASFGGAQDDMANKADSVLRGLEQQGLSAVVLIAKRGSVVLNKGYGLADRARHTPMGPNTVVQIGSNTKDFTIVAILQLYERGKLRLTDSLGRFFDNVPPDKRGITVAQLLNHRAGFPLKLGPDWDVVTHDDFLKRVMATPLLFTPGDSTSYSNPGYSVLAAIIEKVSGTSYDAYVASHISKPAGLKQTGYLEPKFDLARLAHGYRNGEDMGTFLERPHATDGVYWNLRGNGGMLSTVDDMLKFYHALFDTNVLLEPTTRDTRFAPGEPRMLAGSDLVSFFMYNREPASSLELIIATNSTDMPGPRVREAIAGAIGLEGPRGPVAVGRGARFAMSNSIDTTPRQGRGRGGAIGAPSGAAPRAIALPDSPVGRGAAAYFRNFNAGSAERMRAFIQDSIARNPDDSRTIDERVASYVAVHDARGTFTPIAIIASSPTELTVQVHSSGGELTMIFNAEATAPYRLISVRLQAQ